MIIHTSSELVDTALLIAGIHNTDALSWRNKIDFLNNSFRGLYTLLHMQGDRYYEKEIIVDPNEAERDGSVIVIRLPEDFFELQFVGYRNSMGDDIPIVRAPNTTQFFNGYRMVKNEIRYMDSYISGISGNLVIRYLPQPPTLTFPIKPVEDNTKPPPASYPNSSSGNITNRDYCYGQMSYVASNHTLVWNEVGSLDQTELYQNDNIYSVVIADPYVYINLKRGNKLEVIGLNRFSDFFEFKPFQKNGRTNSYEVFAADINDETGLGLWFRHDNSTIYKSGFVPDVVLDYPQNIFFDVLTTDLAITFRAVLDMPIDNLSALHESYMTTMKSFLSRDNYMPARINNVYFHRQGWGY